MIYLTLLFFSSFIFYLYSGIYVYRLNRKSLTNRSFLVLCLHLSCWALGYALMNSAGSAQEANFWRVVSAAGFCFFYSSWLYFSLILTNKGGIVKKLWFRLSLYFPSIIFFINTTRYPPNIFMKNSFGWTYYFTEQNFFQFGFYIYYASFLLAGLLLIYLWGKKSQELREKKQARIIMITGGISIIIGVPIDTLLPLAGISINPLAIVFLAISIWGMWYAIIKYQMMVLTPEVAAEYILKTMMDPVLFVSNNYIIKDMNQAVIDLSNYREEELIGQSLALLVGESNTALINTTKNLQHCSVQNLEIDLFTKEARAIPCLFSGAELFDTIGEVLGMVCVFHDITDRKNAEFYLRQSHNQLEVEVARRTTELESINQQLKDEIVEKEKAQAEIDYIATHDDLTGLPNRRLFNNHITHAIHQMQGMENELAVVFLDIDHFKLINDSLGHTAGDQLLKQVAERLQGTLRKSDMVVRISGDEFVILANNIKGNKNLEMIIKRIRTVFKLPFLLDEYENFVTVSLGVAVYPIDGQDGETLTRNADIAMYEAKAAGRDAYQLCSEEMKLRFVEKTKMRNLLYRAIQKEELSVYYQPQVDVKTGKISGFEALMRWKLNQEKYISPSEFIPLAEETGLIIPMGEWMIRTACKQIKKWQVEGQDKLHIAINFSENQLRKKDFAHQVSEILKEVGLEPSLLEFEITERIIFKGKEDTIKVLDDLKNMGICLSIDDFGIDHSSFMNIKKLPIDKIKIPMEFVQGMTPNSKDEAIVVSIIALSHKMGLGVVAEGVETAEQMGHIKNAFCDVVQGYFLYKPMPDHQIEELLLKNRVCKLCS